MASLPYLTKIGGRCGRYGDDALRGLNRLVRDERGAASFGGWESSNVSLSKLKKAVQEAENLVGKQPKGAPGKWGSPQRGTAEKGFRFDPPHSNRPLGHPESKPHINVWDYTKGKRGSGGKEWVIAVE